MPEGVFGGLVSGLVKGFGGTFLEMEDRAYQEKREEKRRRIELLQAAVDNPNLDDETRQTALDELGVFLDGGKPGGKKAQEFKATLDPIIAATQLISEVPRPKTLNAAQIDDGRGGSATVSVPSKATPGQITPAPRPKYKIKTKAERQAEAVDEALAINSATIRQRFELEDERQQEMLSRIPKEQDEEIARKMGLLVKYGGYKTVADIPKEAKDAVLESVLGIDFPAPTSTKPQKVGAAVQGANLPAEAVDLEGNPITDRSEKATYATWRFPDGALAYQREDRKPLASEVSLQQQIEAARAANPNLSESAARTMVLKNQYESRRLALANASALLAGRELGNALKKDIQDGKLTRAAADNALRIIRQEAQSYLLADRNGQLEPGSPYTGKTQPEIEEILTEFYYGDIGITREQLMQAVAGTTAPGLPSGWTPPQ